MTTSTFLLSHPLHRGDDMVAHAMFNQHGFLGLTQLNDAGDGTEAISEDGLLGTCRDSIEAIDLLENDCSYRTREQIKSRAWATMSQEVSTTLKVSAALWIMTAHFRRSLRGWEDQHPDFFRYAAAYHVEHVFKLHPEVLTQLRKMFPKVPDERLPYGYSGWRRS